MRQGLRRRPSRATFPVSRKPPVVMRMGGASTVSTQCRFRQFRQFERARSKPRTTCRVTSGGGGATLRGGGWSRAAVTESNRPEGSSVMTLKRRAPIPMLACTLCTLLLAGPSRAGLYNVTDLGSLGGVQGSGAYAFSDGVAVGYSFVQVTESVHAMINDHGTVLDLGTLGGSQSLARAVNVWRSEEHTSELQSHSFISYAVFCLKK